MNEQGKIGGDMDGPQLESASTTKRTASVPVASTGNSANRRSAGWILAGIALLGISCLGGIAWRLLRLEGDLAMEADRHIRSIAVDDCARFAEALRGFRTLYTSEVVERAMTLGVHVSHDYLEHPGALPLPATLSMLLGTRLSEASGGGVRLYSDLPFPRGQNAGVTLDEFETEALKRLREVPDEPVFRFEHSGGREVVRYAMADLMRPSCVNCHNTHPESPRTNWKVGDVRGVLEVTRPLSSQDQGTRWALRSTVWMLLVAALLASSAMAMAVFRIRRAGRLVRELDRDTNLARSALERETTQRREAQEQRRAIEAQALQTQKLESIGLLAGGIAHDFNNLLVSILGNADLVDEHLSKDSPARSYLDLLKKGGERASNLTAQLLAYAGRGRISTRPLDLGETVKDIVPLLQTASEHKGSVVFEFASDLPAVEADPAQLEQVVLNLLTNAADALEGDTGTITVRTGLEDVTGAGRDHGEGLVVGRYVFVEIEDDGYGMDPETQRRMFDPFFTTKTQGRGLGLAAIQGIVRAHHGALRVSSKPGAGTTIRAMFPCSSEEVPPVAPQEVTPEGPAPGHTVLVIDDDEDARETTARLLESHGFSVVVSPSGKEGLEHMGRHPEIQGVVLDVMMPGLSGMETCRLLNAQRSGLRTVLVSGFTGEVDLDVFTDDEQVSFLPKPFQIDSLVRALLAS